MLSLLEALFALHDWLSAFVAKHLVTIKKLILVVAHLSLLGLLLPDLRRSFGQIAEFMLLVILFLSPVSRILRMRLLLQFMGLRRELGIFMAYLATVHGIGYLIDPAWVAVFVAPFVNGETFPLNPTYVLGGVAYLLTLPLLFTSNDLMQRFLNSRNWKRLHRSVYLVLPLVLLHHFSVRRGLNASGWIQAVMLLALYLLLKVLAWKNRLTLLQAVLDWVATRYREYTVARNAISPPARVV